jgi:hypothetical protein
MHIHVQALGGQGYARELGPLLVPQGGGSLSPMLGMHRTLSHTNNCLLFFVAGSKAHSEQ